jgi:DNA-binding HxlR family transcriptional regulator
MAVLDLLGRRWTLRVLWELRGHPATFRVLRQRCAEMSSSVLSRRLNELSAAGVLTSTSAGYELTKRGAELVALLEPLSVWADAGTS